MYKLLGGFKDEVMEEQVRACLLCEEAHGGERGGDDGDVLAL